MTADPSIDLYFDMLKDVAAHRNEFIGRAKYLLDEYFIVSLKISQLKERQPNLTEPIAEMQSVLAENEKRLIDLLREMLGPF